MCQGIAKGMTFYAGGEKVAASVVFIILHKILVGSTWLNSLKTHVSVRLLALTAFERQWYRPTFPA
jgi:hypothetical protein